jgi:hypothetical protein
LSSFDEAAWWGDCGNTFHEEQKQITYATRMGLRPEWTVAHPPQFDLGGHSVIDIGGGPVSLLLKCVNRGHAIVVDPADFPSWVFERYRHCDIELWHGKAEEIEGGPRYDEAWIYNVLQHVEDPELVIRNARASAEIIRLFEWVDQEPRPGHPNLLTEELLNGWLGGTGFVANVNENGAVGRAYYGVFKTVYDSAEGESGV